MDAGGSSRPISLIMAALVVGVCLCIFMAWTMGHKSLAIVSAIIEGAWGSWERTAFTLTKTAPLMLTGLAVAVAYRVGLLNIGCEGQLTLGALGAASCAANLPSLPGWMLISISLAAAAGLGAILAYPAVWFKQKRGVHEVISALLINYIVINLADYLVRGPLGDGTSMARSPEIHTSAVLTILWRSGSIGLSYAPLFALFLAAVFNIWLFHTVWGFEVSATGDNRKAARAAGIPVNLWEIRCFVASGAIAGIAGALEVLAVHQRFYANFSPGYGFDGITVAFLVNNHPGWLWLSSLLLASMRASDKWLQLALDISPNVVLVIEAVLLLVVAGQRGWSVYLAKVWRGAVAVARRVVLHDGKERT